MLKSSLNANSKNLYSKLLGSLINKGKKNSAKEILDSAFLIVSKKTKLSLHSVLLKIFFKLNTYVEARKLRIKRSSYIVPFAITLKRRFYLVTKWLISSAKQDTRQISMSEKLSNEILSLLKKKSYCKSKKKKELNNSQALTNRSNIHFRW